jgi:uncharacterized HAD superfamily protein
MTPDKIKQRMHKVEHISIDFDGTIMPLLADYSFITPTSHPLFRPLINTVEIVAVSIIQAIQKPFKRSSSTIKFLSQRYKLSVLTSRPAHLTSHTTGFLDTHSLSAFFADIFHNQTYQKPYFQKRATIIKQSIDLHIDDDPHTISILSRRLPNKLFIHFNPKRHYTPINHNNTLEVHSWQDIRDLFK